MLSRGISIATLGNKIGWDTLPWHFANFKGENEALPTPLHAMLCHCLSYMYLLQWKQQTPQLWKEGGGGSGFDLWSLITP